MSVVPLSPCQHCGRHAPNGSEACPCRNPLRSLTIDELLDVLANVESDGHRALVEREIKRRCVR